MYNKLFICLSLFSILTNDHERTQTNSCSFICSIKLMPKKTLTNPSLAILIQSKYDLARRCSKSLKLTIPKSKIDIAKHVSIYNTKDCKSSDHINKYQQTNKHSQTSTRIQINQQVPCRIQPFRNNY